MKLTLNVISSVILMLGFVALYQRAIYVDIQVRPMAISVFVFYFGLLVVASSYFWKDIFVFHCMKWLFSDLSFPRGTRWLPWWGAFIILVAAVRAAVWIYTGR
jgi:hypothetical protein